MTKTLMTRLRLALAASLLALAATNASAAVTLTRSSGGNLYLQSGLSNSYVAYLVTNDATPRADVWVKVTGQNGLISLTAQDNGLVHIGPMAANQTASAYFYIQKSGFAKPHNFLTVTVFEGSALVTTLASDTTDFAGAFDAGSTCVANAATGGTVSGSGTHVGETLTISVSGHTGVFGGAPGTFELAFSPGTSSSWPADAFKLTSTTVVLSGGNTDTFTDTLIIPGASLTGAADTNYTVTYVYTVTKATATPTSVEFASFMTPIAGGRCHSDNAALALIPTIPTVTGASTTLSKLVSNASLVNGGTVTYTLRLSNTGGSSVTLDQLVDTLPGAPANASVVAGTSKFNGSTIADPSIASQTATWGGLFAVPSGTTRDLVFDATIPATAGT